MRTISWQQALRLKVYVFIVVLLMSLMINRGHATKSQLADWNLDYNGYLGAYKKWAESCKDFNSGALHQIQFTIKDIDKTLNHQTVITAKRFYRTSSMQKNVETEDLPFLHKKTFAKPTPLQKFYLKNGILYRPHEQSVEHFCPALSLVGLLELRYTILNEDRQSYEIDPRAFIIRQAGKPISKPTLGDYLIESQDISQQASSYIYSTGTNFVLACAFAVNCWEEKDKNKETTFNFSYVVQTPYQLTIKPECEVIDILVAPKTRGSLNSPFGEGVYKKAEDGKWVQIHDDFTRSGLKSYLIEHPEGSWIEKVSIGPSSDSNNQVLTLLGNLTYLSDVAGLDFSGRVFSPGDQTQLITLLRRMPQIKSLTFAIEGQDALSQSLVPTLLSLPNLTYLNAKGLGDQVSCLENSLITYSLAKDDGYQGFVLESGFSVPEGTHRWTDGSTATLRLPLNSQFRGLKCLSFIDTKAHLPNKHTQYAVVRVNGTAVGQYHYEGKSFPQSHTIHVPIPTGIDEAVITFDLPKAIPEHNGTRQLGIHFHQVRLSFAKMIYNLATGDGFPGLCLLPGFSVPEWTHRWTAGDTATLKVPVVHNHQRVKSVVFKDTSGLGKGDHTQRVQVSVNGNTVAHYHYKTDEDSHTIRVPIPEDSHETALIQFDIPNAISPTDLGMKTDPRILGIKLNQVELSFDQVLYNLAVDKGVPSAPKGFSVLEGTHCWTEGTDAMVEFPMVHQGRRLKKISFLDTFGLGIHQHMQTLGVSLNGRHLRQYHYTAQSNTHTLKIAVHDNKADTATIAFSIPSATKSVTDLTSGQNKDDRKLGIAFGQVKLWYPIEIQQ